MSENPEGPSADDPTRRVGNPPPDHSWPGQSTPPPDQGYGPGGQGHPPPGQEYGSHGQPDQRYGGYPPYTSPYTSPYASDGYPGGYQHGYPEYGAYGPPPRYGHQAPPGTYGPRPGSDDTTMAMLAHLLGLLTSFVGPLVLYLAKKDESPYARDQAAEALNFQLTVLIAYAVCWVLAFVFIGFLLMFFLWVGSIVMAIVAALAANRGETYRYPINIRFVG
ncbi:DUF4870 domain-containing protein [Streptosporangium sp. NPDC000509]|uniref:DUF4870 domain-containing protein n=1 Tax=Streptosporangium sp. NPDC000509 TaxID=3366186 RepID=UPI00367364CD